MAHDEHSPDDPEPAQQFMYHAGGKLSRFLAKFSGEDPVDAEQAWQDGVEQLTDDADPVLIANAIGNGIDLGFGLVEKRRALRDYHRDQAARELAPPAYDSEELWEGDELVGLRVLVSEPDCRFFTDHVDDELLVRTAEGGEATIDLGFAPGEIDPVEDTDSISEVIVRPFAGHDTTVAAEQSCKDPDVVTEEYLDAAREVVLEDPGRALLAEGDDDAAAAVLVSALLERKPSVPVEDAHDIIHDAIKHVGLDTLEDRYVEHREDTADEDGDTRADSDTSDSDGEDTDDSDG